MLKVKDLPAPVLFLTVNADGPEFFTTKIRSMKPKADDGGGTKQQATPEPIMGDVRGGCSLADLVGSDLTVAGYRLVFVRNFGKSSTFGFAQGDVALRFEEGEDLPLHVEIYDELKKLLTGVKWNGVRLTTKPLTDFAGVEIPGQLACSVGAVFPKTMSKESKSPSKLRLVDGAFQVKPA